ncbi:MAG: DNA polymerase III subunit beta [Candidatus Tectomicrobia bacterium]|nr:DNA polymerase III subunit beta [Candidatus Tectomicrobia bacterium]
MHAAIADKKAQLAKICRRYGVIRLEVFGSAARGADFDPATSDALGRPVELVENHEFRNPYLAASINASREVVYAS